jgi:hypothetical protein
MNLLPKRLITSQRTRKWSWIKDTWTNFTFSITNPIILKILILKEESHKMIEDYYLMIHKKEMSQVTLRDEERGRTPGVVLFIAAVCAAKGNIPAETVWNDWNYDLLNLNLDLDDEAYENYGVSNAVIKLIAIRNGVPAAEVEKWDLD